MADTNRNYLFVFEKGINVEITFSLFTVGFSWVSGGEWTATNERPYDSF